MPCSGSGHLSSVRWLVGVALKAEQTGSLVPPHQIWSERAANRTLPDLSLPFCQTPPDASRGNGAPSPEPSQPGVAPYPAATAHGHTTGGSEDGGAVQEKHKGNKELVSTRLPHAAARERMPLPHAATRGSTLLPVPATCGGKSCLTPGPSLFRMYAMALSC